VSRSDAELVRDALDHIAALRRHMERHDLADEIIVDAVSLRLSAAIEAVSRASAELRERLFGGDWTIIWATRNRIAHGYAHISVDVIRATVADDLPDFEKRLRECLAGLD
jgi:uncharacterized protein with HEPN domain